MLQHLAADAPRAVAARNWQSMLDQMKSSGFNTIRLPYSNELFTQTAPPTEGIDYGQNPDLKGLYGLDLMDRIVKGATDRGLMVPVYLSQLGLIDTLGDSTVKLLKTTSFAIMIFALLLGAFIVLRAMWQGRQAERLQQASGALEHGEV